MKDLDSKSNKAVSAFKISGIPAKFVVDKKGYIRFKKLGYQAGEDTEAEISVMIELAEAS